MVAKRKSDGPRGRCFSHALPVNFFSSIKWEKLSGMGTVRKTFNRCRGKLGHLTGETKKPEVGDPKINSWRSENSLVIAWLINSMEPVIGKSYLFLPTAKDVWEAVTETYSDVENAFQIFELKIKLWQAKQGENEVTTYYNEMVSLWLELD